MNSANAHWLNITRLSVYPKIIFALYVIVGVGALCHWWFQASPHDVIVSDQTVFWVAAQMALSGHSAEAYIPDQLHKAMALIAPDIKGAYGWFYPPTFYLLILPLGLLPYWAAYSSFMIASVTAYVAVFRKFVNGKTAMWLLAAFPGIWINLLTGQNGLLTAALAGAALLSLERKSTLAGILIGLLVIKPHLALLFPLALIARKAWRVLAISGLTALLYMSLSVLVLGFDSISAWLHGLDVARSIMVNGKTSPMMPTVFSFMRMLRAAPLFSYAAHGFVALWSARIVWIVWRSDVAYLLKAASLMTATLLASPYLFEYDLAWLGFPIAWIAKIGHESTWKTGEREVLLAAWFTPLIVVVFALLTKIQIGPFVSAALLWTITRRIPEFKFWGRREA